MLRGLFYNFQRLLWSIYFVIGIGVVGLFCAYIGTAALVGLSKILGWLYPTWGKQMRYHSEIFFARAIRFLLIMQPWLRCRTNFDSIGGYFDQFHSRRVLFVGNHRSNMDTFLLISYIPGLRGLAKSSLFKNFFFAPIMHMMGFIPVDKNSMPSFVNGLRRLRDDVFGQDLPVLMFPENTRREPGKPPIGKFSASGFALAMESNALIVPLVLKNTDQILGKGDMLLRPFAPVEIKQLQPVDPSRFTNPLVLRDFVFESIRSELA